MDNSITELIKNEIKRQYKSVRKFSAASGIPYSTLSNALAKGIGGTSYDTVVKICRLLNIRQAIDSDIVLFNDQFQDIYAKLTQLDPQGLHTVKTVLNVEYERCMGENSEPVVKQFNGIGYARAATNDLDIRQIEELIKEVLKNR